MQNANVQIFRIPIDGPRKKLTQQTIHDNEKLNIRILENKQRLQIIDQKMVNKKGKKMTMYELFDLAQTISEITKRKIDRLARRNRNGLLCWLAESIDIISNKETLDEIKKRLGANNVNTNIQTMQQEINDQQQEDTTQSNQNNAPYPEITYPTIIENPISISDKSTNDKEEKTPIQRQLFPEVPEQIILPPLINHKGNSPNTPNELISIYSLLNHM